MGQGNCYIASLDEDELRRRREWRASAWEREETEAEALLLFLRAEGAASIGWLALRSSAAMRAARSFGLSDDDFDERGRRAEADCDRAELAEPERLARPARPRTIGSGSESTSETEEAESSSSLDAAGVRAAARARRACCS